MSQEIDALALLKDEMQTEEIHLKVNAIHRLKIVILTLGDQIVKNLVIPYLDELIASQDDEVLFAIAEELGKCWDYLDDKTLFLPQLERLARSDETVVREQAARSLISISQSLSDGEIQNNFVPLVIRLAQAEWFTGRVSSTILFQHTYARSGSQKERLRKKFMELCQEDTPMIRRACATRLGEFAQKIEKNFIIQELLPIFRQLAQDEQDQIRVLCLESLIPIATQLSKEENQMHTMGTLLAAGEDKSWKVRLCFAKRFAQFSEAFGKDLSDANLVQTFNLLLIDSEPEVKNTAITSLAKALQFLTSEKICQLILPQISATYAESQTSYKAGVALALCEMVPKLGKDYTIQKVMPILIELLKDDCAEVRLNVVQNLTNIVDVVSTDMISPSFITILVNLTKDNQWRVRMANIQLLGNLSVKFGHEIYKKSLQSIFMTYLTNSAASVREMGNRMVQDMAVAFKDEWIKDNFLPSVIETYNTEKVSFNIRMACLEAMSAVMPAASLNVVKEQIVPTLKKALEDKIPNVQFTSARIIKLQAKYIDKTVKEIQLLEPLKKCMEDEDKDVRYFAMLAVEPN